MKLFDNKTYYWAIVDSHGKYWSSRDQNWMGFTRVTLYKDKKEAEQVLSSASFMLKTNMEEHDPYIERFSVERG